MKQMGERSAGNPHAAFDVAGAGNVARSRYLGRSRRASPRPYRRGGDWKRGAVERPAGAPVLDPTAQNVERKMRNFLGHKFWARGYFVTTVGRDEEVIRAYIRNQELADRQLEQFELKISAAQNSINRPNIP
ncbi:Transposase IS200 like [Bradyrhizobium erythrophlei]|nr:Transposase IS200 like [Bradyrhizobium erythrophlei]